MKIPVSFFVLLGFLAPAAITAAPVFTWEPGTVSAKVKVDHKTLKIGQYLYVTHDGSGNENWNMAKLDLPESWKIKAVNVDGRVIEVTTENAGDFLITSGNLGALWRALLKAKKTPAPGGLEGIWRTHAGKG